jgi:E3 ubiquitin-protein ligase BIG BROTHER and related proteins
MNMSPYKFGMSGPGSTSYYNSYEVNDHLPRMENNRVEWEYPTEVITEEPATSDSPPRRDGVNMQTIPEEC